MRYRKLSPTGDYVFGQGSRNFHVDTPETVAQAITTRLKLIEGEWFLDRSIGTPWFTEILGNGTDGLRDAAIREAIENTAGVVAVRDYFSSVDRDTRTFNVQCVVETAFGTITYGQQ